MCPHATIYVSSYYYICVLILILLYICPHTATYVPSYYYICVLILLYMCPPTAGCVGVWGPAVSGLGGEAGAEGGGGGGGGRSLAALLKKGKGAGGAAAAAAAAEQARSHCLFKSLDVF